MFCILVYVKDVVFLLKLPSIFDLLNYRKKKKKINPVLERETIFILHNFCKEFSFCLLDQPLA